MADYLAGDPVPEIVCDWCKRLTPLDHIRRRFRRWPAIGPTQFICDDCRAREKEADSHGFYEHG